MYCPARWIRLKCHLLSIYYRERHGDFLEKCGRPPSCESPLKYRAPSCILIGYLKTIANGAHSSVSSLLFTTYSCWQRRYEQIWICLHWRNSSSAVAKATYLTESKLSRQSGSDYFKGTVTWNVERTVHHFIFSYFSQRLKGFRRVGQEFLLIEF
jgi:hypothetical protein